MALNTPVLLLMFNRLDTTKQVVERIREVAPKQLFIVADGARTGREGEKEKCELVRQWVLNAVDWSCEVKTLFREHNLGCGKSVSGGITWFFEQVEQGIILEDDTLPDVSFFRFASELLECYKNDEQVMSISAANLMADKVEACPDSYFFSN